MNRLRLSFIAAAFLCAASLPASAQTQADRQIAYSEIIGSEYVDISGCTGTSIEETGAIVIWKVTEITADGKETAVLQDEKGNKVRIGIGNIFKNVNGSCSMIPLETYRHLEETYGKKYIDALNRHRLRKGMPTEMVILLKGMPDEKKTYGRDFQWIYRSGNGNEYLYLTKDGQLAGVNRTVRK
ncbi:MAG: hypothetical protein MJY86_06320 [Bacteroidales bacterium]|nr:hypothetical protein [Bacteroidales bacterium]